MSLRPHPLDQLLHSHLRAFLQDADDAALDVLQHELEWIELPAGGVLMRQGDPGDAMYVLASGRLRVSIGTAGGVERVVRECTRGQVVGEMALITDELRSATVMAMRDSVLARLAKPAFAQLLQQHPAVSMALTRQIIKRLQTEGRTTRPDRPVAIALLPLGGRLDAAAASALADGLAAELAQHGRVARVDAAFIAGRLGHVPGDDAASMRRVAVALDEIEAAHDTVLLLADPAPTAWTRCCARQGDEVLLLAHADDDPQPGAVELACGLAGDARKTLPATVLVLQHPADRRSPTGTARWLAPRQVRAHVHLRQGRAADVARLGRLVGRRGVGLVLAGGGARGAAHAGVYQALGERGVPVDAIGGTSMGAVFGALMAFDTTGADVVDTFAAHFAANPTGDFTLLPLMSLIKGRRLRGMMQRTELTFGGSAGLDIEDLWKPYFSVVSNYTRAAEQVLTNGPLVDAVMASCAIPGALPPVLREKELLCDGGVFNNFPVEQMRATWGVGRVIGVDIGLDPPRALDMVQMPTPGQLLLDRLRPRRQRRYRLPSLANYLMNVTALYGTSRQRAASGQVDLLLRPSLPRIGMLDWRHYREAVQVGYETALKALDGADPRMQPMNRHAPPAPPGTGPSVAIIGAGPAGITAALELRALGLCNITVFGNPAEAQFRTLDIDGVTADVGTCYLHTGYWTTVMPLARQMGCHIDYLDRPTMRDDQGRTPVLSRAERLGTLVGLLRFIGLSLWFRLHHRSARSRDYGVPMQQFLEARGLGAFSRSFALGPGGVAQGYGPLDDVTAHGALQWFRPSMFLTPLGNRFRRGTAMVREGYEVLFRRALEGFALRCETVQSVQPDPGGGTRVTLSSGETVHTDLAVLACRLDRVQSPASALLPPGTVRRTRFFSYLWTADTPPDAPDRIYLTDAIRDSRRDCILSYRCYGRTRAGTYVYWGAGYASEALDETALGAALVRQVQQEFGHTVLSQPHFRCHDYNVRFSAEAVRDGVPLAIDAMQGDGGIWYSGGLLSHWDVDSIMKHNRRLALRIAGRLGTHPRAWLAWRRLRATLGEL